MLTSRVRPSASMPSEDEKGEVAAPAPGINNTARPINDLPRPRDRTNAPEPKYIRHPNHLIRVCNK